jgi:hypothetical protein
MKQGRALATERLNLYREVAKKHLDDIEKEIHYFFNHFESSL